MRVLHLVPQFEPSAGIVRQALSEQAAADTLNLPWDVRVFTDVPGDGPLAQLFVGHGKVPQVPKSRAGRLLGKVSHRRRMYDWLNSQDRWDVLVVRHTYSDLLRSRKLKQLHTPVVSMHHTLEVPELRLAGGLSGRARALVEHYAGARAIRNSAGVAGVTREIVDYELKRARVRRPGFVVPNGIAMESVRVAGDGRTDTPELLFVASKFAPWHGLDLLLDAARRHDGAFVLHLVGDLPAELRAQAELDHRVMIHGKLGGEDIRHVAARCWAGLSSFALERNMMTEASTLKVREYLAMGLPTYAGHRDVFPPAARFYRAGPASISEAVRFAAEFRDVERESIRNDATPWISKEAILEQFYGQLVAEFAKR